MVPPLFANFKILDLMHQWKKEKGKRKKELPIKIATTYGYIFKVSDKSNTPREKGIKLVGN